MRQNQLSSSQLSSFYHDLFVDKQVEHFGTIAAPSAHIAKTVVDIGGGCGYFSKAIEDAYHVASRVIDADPVSVETARSLGVAAEVGDALRPAIRADDGIACFNLILHHLVGGSERDTLSMQVRAITAWRDSGARVFVNEYIYESWSGDISGKIIYRITRSRILSSLGRFVARLVPSLKANTFGVGVRFRSCGEWRAIFERAGFEIIGYAKGDCEYVSPARRLLLISEIRRDSFLLRAK